MKKWIIFVALVATGVPGIQQDASGMSFPGNDPKPEFETEIVNQVGAFRSPSRIALTTLGELYVADSTAGIVAIYDVSGLRVGTLKGVDSPLGVAVMETTVSQCVNPSGEIISCKGLGKERNKVEVPINYTWVGDSDEGSVRKFIGNKLAGYLGAGPGELLRPNGIAASSKGMVYVVDSGAHRVAVYNKPGNLAFQFASQGAGDGEVMFPTDIEIDETAGEVYVGDFGNQRIAVFDLDGNWLHNLAAPLNDSGDPAFIGPSGLGLDPAGKLYVTDNALSCVVVMDRTGMLLDIIGYQQGYYWTGDLEVPIDAASDGVNVFVTSSGHGHVNVFEAAPPGGDQ